MAIGRRKKFDPSLIIGIALFAGVAVFASFILTRANPMDGVDPKTFCRTEGDRSRTVVILDVTDPLTSVQQQTLKNRLQEVQESIGRFDRLDIFVIGETSEDLLRPVATACNPGDPSQVDELTTGRKFIAEKFRTLFAEPIEAVFQTALQAKPASQSPIMEAVQAASASTFDAEARNHGNVVKKLFVISDMMQNSPLLSMYQGIPSYSSVANRPEFRKASAPLSGVDVEVITIPRATAAKITDRELATFWTDYFVSQGAKLSRWRNIS